MFIQYHFRDFKSVQLPPLKENEDPCKQTIDEKIKNYQHFVQ